VQEPEIYSPATLAAIPATATTTDVPARID